MQSGKAQSWSAHSCGVMQKEDKKASRIAIEKPQPSLAVLVLLQAKKTLLQSGGASGYVVLHLLL